MHGPIVTGRHNVAHQADLKTRRGAGDQFAPSLHRPASNFQREPTADTSEPFLACFVPTPDDGGHPLLRPRGIGLPYLLSMIPGSCMSRASSIVATDGKLDLAMQLILTPMILCLIERKRRTE